MKPQLKVVTNSELEVRARCKREHFFLYMQGYRPVEDAEALYFGKQWHYGMEAWWNGDSIDDAIYVATQGVTDLYEAAKLRVLLRGYHARWHNETDFGDVVRAEREFLTPIINPQTGAASRTFVLGGKIDVECKRSFVEHKTTSEEIGFGSIYWRNLVLDSQISTYYKGMRGMAREVDGVLYDVIRKPALRPSNVPITDVDGVKIVLDANGARVRTKDQKKWRETGDTAQRYVLQTRIESAAEFEDRMLEEVSSNPDKYYQRGTVVRLEAEEFEAALDMWQLTQIMREDLALNRHPRNPRACKRWSRMCPFFDVCCQVASLDDTSRFTRVENMHPELSGTEAAE